MNKKLKQRLLATSVAVAMILPGVPVMARETASLTQFALPAWQAVVSTDLLLKATTNAPWVLNITALSNASTVDTYLANSNGEQRSDYTVVGVGRHEINSSGTANFYYKAVLMNHNSQWSTGYLSGSWSPDNK